MKQKYTLNKSQITDISKFIGLYKRKAIDECGISYNSLYPITKRKQGAIHSKIFIKLVLAGVIEQTQEQKERRQNNINLLGEDFII